MKTNFKKLPGSKIELEVELDKNEFLPYYKRVDEQAIANVQIKGFRPGMAPRELAEQAVDKEKIFNEAVQNAVRWSLDEISKDHEWTFIDTPQIEIEDTKDLGLIYKANLTIFPEIKLGNYKKIAKKVLSERKPTAVDAKEIEQTLDWIRHSRKEGLPAGGRGDKIPELNDEFAKSLGKFQNVEELRKSVGDGVKMEKEAKETDRLRLKIIDEIIKDSEIDTPEVMIQKTYDGLYPQLSRILKAGGKSAALDGGEPRSTEIEREEDIKKEVRERAKNNVETNLVIYKIAQMEHLEPTPEEVRAREGSVESDRNYQYIYGMLQSQKVYEFLEKQ